MKKFTDFLKEGERGLWDNIHAKRERIKNGSGERMRKPGSKGAPTAEALKKSQTNEELTPEQMFDLIEEMAEQISEQLQMDLEQVWEELDEFSDNELLEACNCWTGYKRKPGTKPCAEDSCVKEEHFKVGDFVKDPDGKIHRIFGVNGTNLETGIHYGKNKYGGTNNLHTSKAKKISTPHDVKEENLAKLRNEELHEAAVDAKGHKSSTGGLTQKGRDAYNRKEGSNLKAPVTTPPSKLKAGSKAANRRKSFCARMSGVEGPMKKPNGEPTRKALALRKWNC